jgi:hypothetical protein
MAPLDATMCAVKDCGNPIWGPNNLCDCHRLPGIVVLCADGSLVVTMWVAEHDGEFGVIIMDDFGIGDLFGGEAGFKARLAKQGFTNVMLLETPEEINAANESMWEPETGKKVGKWAGPWLPRYPWEGRRTPKGKPQETKRNKSGGRS